MDFPKTFEKYPNALTSIDQDIVKSYFKNWKWYVD